MFFLKELTHTLQLHPSYFGKETASYLVEKLHADVEDTCSGRYGFIVAVFKVDDLGQGIIAPGHGLAEFEVKYSAIVFKPFKGEVADGVVTLVNKLGFFADIGPLNVFVSSHLIPSEYKFDASANPPCFVSKDKQITKDSQVRMRIVGLRVDATEIFAIATIKEDFLGLFAS